MLKAEFGKISGLPGLVLLTRVLTHCLDASLLSFLRTSICRERTGESHDSKHCPTRYLLLSAQKEPYVQLFNVDGGVDPWGLSTKTLGAPFQNVLLGC